MSEGFLDASDAAIAGFVAEHADEFGTSDVSAEKILLAVAEKRMVIERRRYGFAILEVEGRPRWFYSPGANLCYLYVLPEHRKRGFGQEFVRELIEKHAVQYRMTLYASEPWRIEFYESCGFEVTEDKGDGSFLMEMVDDYV